jgi:hypothetical protein
MFDKLLNLVKENAGDAIINNPAVPNERNNDVIQEATKSLFKSLQGTAKKDGSQISDLFRQEGTATTHPVTQQVSNNVAGDLMKKFGLDKGAANGIVAMLIPVVMSKLVHKTNDPNDKSFGFDDILGSLTGKGNILGTLKGMFGR